MKKLLLLLSVILVQSCATIPEGYISQEEADRQKHAYFCTTYTLMSYNLSEHLPHCVNRSINQQQAKALFSWMMSMDEAFLVEAKMNPELKTRIPAILSKNYELVKRLKPYLYQGDYYYFLKDISETTWRYYRYDEDDPEQLAYWDKIAMEDFEKLKEVGGGLDNHWARPEYSNEKQNELLMAAAIRGNASAQKILGQLYLNGELGFKKNLELGIAWIEQSARREPNSLDFSQLQKFKEYFSTKDYRYWQIMYLLSSSKGDDSFDDFDGDLLQRLMGEISDWKHFCDKYQKQRWFLPQDENDLIFEKYQAIQTIILQCVTQYPPAKEPYINDLDAH